MINEKIILADKLLDQLDSDETSDYVMKPENLRKVQSFLSQQETVKLLECLKDKANKGNIDYLDLSDISDSVSKVYEIISKVKEDIELEEFFTSGKLFDLNDLEKRLKKKKLLDKFPKFNFERYKEIVSNPPLSITNFEGVVINYDPFLVKKLLISINQMLFNEMDLYITTTGKEGSGKSCFSSQIILWLYTVLKDLGLLDYEYDVTKLFFSSVQSIIELQSIQKNDDYFRIMCLDEAYDLNRQNYHEQTSKIFKDDMRASRKMLRIIILNLPQLGELDLSISLSRTNFIFNCNMDNEIKSGTLKKGIADFYIIPRGKYIYSPLSKRNVSSREILEAFSKKLEKKNYYYAGFPNDVIIEKISFQDVWGFDKKIYDEHIKNENKRKNLLGEVKTSDYIAYILWKKLPDTKHWGNFDLKDQRDIRMYKAFKKWKALLDNKFEMNPDLVKRYDSIYSVGETQNE